MVSQRVRLQMVIPVVALLAMVYATGCSRQGRVDRARDRADSYFTSGEYLHAEVEYLGLLKLDQKDAHAISRLGQIYIAQGMPAKGVPYLVAARQLKPDDLDARVKLGTVMLISGQVDDARAEAGFVLERRPDDPEAPLILAETARKSEEVASVRQQLLNTPPDARPTASRHAALAILALREDNPQEASIAIEKALAIDPNSSAAHAARAQLLLRTNDVGGAITAMRKALDYSPPRSPLRLSLARLLLQNNDRAGAEQVLRDTIDRASDFLPASIMLAEILVADQKPSEGEVLIARVMARDPGNPEARLLAARIKLAEGKGPDAVADFERLAADLPQSPQIAYQLAVAQLATGDSAKAAASLARATSLAPDYVDALVLQASLNIQRGDFGAVVAALKPIATRQPELMRIRLLLAEAYRGLKQYDEALDIYAAITEALPAEPQALVASGIVLIQAGRPEEARAAFTKALDRAPDFMSAAEQLLNLDIAEGRLDSARQRAVALQSAYPDRAESHLLRARAAMAASDTDTMEQSLRRVIELRPELPAPYLMLARLYLNADRHAEALSNLRELLERNPNDVPALMMTGMLQQQQGDQEAARESYERLIKVNPRFSPALNNLAYLYSEHLHDLDKAYELANRARELQPRDPYALDTLGWILFQKREYGWAVGLLTESAEKLPAEPEVHYHLGMTHYMLGRPDEARRHLDQAVNAGREFNGVGIARARLRLLEIDPLRATSEDLSLVKEQLAATPDDPIARTILGSIEEGLGNFVEARQAFEEALKATPGSARAMYQLARFLTERTGDTDRALELASDAYKLAPEDPNVAHVLGRLAYRTGKRPWAASLLSDAARRSPDDPELLFDAAVAAFTIGRIEDADATATKALTLDREFARAAEARSFLDLLRFFVKGGPAPSGPREIEAGLDSVSLGCAARAALAALYENANDRTAAATAYESLLGTYPEFTPAYRRLALLLADDPASTARVFDLATRAREAYPDDPLVARALGIASHRRGDYSRAAVLLRECTRAKNDDAEAFYYLGLAESEAGNIPASRSALERALRLGLPQALEARAREALGQ